MSAKRLFLVAVALLPATICCAGAVYLAVNGVTEWMALLVAAWFLFPNIRWDKD